MTFNNSGPGPRASKNGARLFWFEAMDEPWKGNFDPKAYDSNRGAWHYCPANPSSPFPPNQPLQGRFTKKY